MCIFAIISAVKKKVMSMSRLNVMYMRDAYNSNVRGVLMLTDTMLTNAHALSKRRVQGLFTHSMSALSFRFSSGP